MIFFEFAITKFMKMNELIGRNDILIIDLFILYFLYLFYILHQPHFLEFNIFSIYFRIIYL